MSKTTKIIAALGVVAGIGVAATPLAGVNAALTTSRTDTIEVKINDNCELSYGSTAHTAGVVSDDSGAAATSWDNTTNTLTGTMANNTVSSNFGKSSFSVTCNNTAGSQVKLTAGSLATGTTGDFDKIDLGTSAPVAGTSSWAVYSSNTTGASTPEPGYVANDGNAWASPSATGVSAATFDITYKVGLSTTQEAGTYTGTAKYTLSAKS